ncbi:hypothetical protein AKJ56_00420 [candidate division MSBL1 archaeon SCGC-AAA382N08]|uniref:Transcription regulator PadR N-terminal domain-containing protein n=1 Tax=candidate division MSBL1 archaeon SCGC-AAA382N08 TaxID=1698285 RepID=A0A133VQN7_9EURY|nr:hypothetical protein AKJ56_00420 [candidate division MSBL1 archaeon SCGC-AAA382N08]
MELTKKEFYFTTKLLVKPDFKEYDGSLLDKIKNLKNKFRKSEDKYTKNEIGTKFLGFGKKMPTNGYDYLKKLEDNGVLEKDGVKKYHSQRNECFKINRDKLLEELKKSEFYEKNKELFIEILEEEGFVVIE